MLVAITGTPGVGKTSVSKNLKKMGYIVVNLNQVSKKEGFISGVDKKRKSNIVDIASLNKFIEKKYKDEKLIFFDGHLSHLLKCVDKIILLRCHPKVLEKHLKNKRWNKKKIKENIEAEILDVILCESVEIHNEKDIFEINTTDLSIDSIVLIIKDLIKKGFSQMKKYNIGKVDWTEELLLDKGCVYGS